MTSDTQKEEKRKLTLQKIQEKADEHKEEFDEGTAGHTIGEILDRLGGAMEKKEDLNEEIGFDLAGNANALNFYQAEEVMEEIQESIEEAEEEAGKVE